MQAASRSATRKPLFDFAQRQERRHRRQQAAVKLTTTGLPKRMTNQAAAASGDCSWRMRLD